MSTSKNAVPLPFSAPTVHDRSRTDAENYGPEYYHNYHNQSGRPYSREYPEWLEFFGRMADRIVRSIHPRTALDVGCAHGFLVESLRDRGVDAYGIDVSAYAISQVRNDIEPFCRVGSATDDIERHYDLITCIEVCEHLTELEARRAIRNMTAHADAVLFSSTPNDFSDRTHVSVQPVIYWLRAFREFSFAPDLSFDTSVVSPQLILFRRVEQKPSDQWLTAIARMKTDAVVAASRKAESQVQDAVADLKSEIEILKAELQSTQEELSARTETLNAVLNSRGWKLLNQYRNLRTWALQQEASRRLGFFLLGTVTGRATVNRQYRRWIETREKPSIDVPAIQRSIAEFKYTPTISIVMPVYNTPAELLDAALGSVRAQYYENWEVCICNDGSTASHVRKVLDAWAEKDSRIRIVHSENNEGISTASNRALAIASGEYVGLLDHDDELSANALYENVRLLQQHPEADMIYSDEDKLTSKGRRVDPFFKPDWSPEYMLSTMYTCHFGVYRKRLLDQIGGFRVGFEGSQDYDLVLRLIEKTDHIFHIPKILYHWRMAKGSSAVTHGCKPYASTVGKKALLQHLARRGTPGRVRDGKWPGHYRVAFAVDANAKVSILIPSRNQARLLRGCIESIEAKTQFHNYEILVVDNQSDDPEAIAYLASLPHRVVAFTDPFNFSRIINFGAKCASGNYLLFLNNDTRVISPQWLDTMLGLCQQKPIGIVGAKLLYPNNRIQHAGVVLGIGGIAGHAMRGFLRDSKARFGIAGDIRNYSALTAACMMIRKDVFDEVGGFDENIAVAFNDVDFSLRVREAGYRNVYTPDAELYHLESASRGFALNTSEIAYVQQRWGSLLTCDPYYNPNLSLKYEDFRLDVPRSNHLLGDCILGFTSLAERLTSRT